jgi:hypothetical protein
MAKQILKNGQLFKLLNAVLKTPGRDHRGVRHEHPRLAVPAPRAPQRADLRRRSHRRRADLQLFPYNETVQAAAAATLGNLASNAQAVAQIVKNGGARPSSTRS